jgi:hypothetical protein
MARDPVAPSPARPGGWAWYRPWPVLAVGLLLTVAGLGLAQFIHDPPPDAWFGVVPDRGGLGCKITEVVRDSPAEKFGLKEGDVVTRFDNHPVDSYEHLIFWLTSRKQDEEVAADRSKAEAGGAEALLKSRKPDEEVPVLVQRDGKPLTLKFRRMSGVPLTGGLETAGEMFKPRADDDYVPVQGESLNPYRFLLLFAGLLLAGIAVRLRFKEATWQLDGRLETAAVLASSAVVALLAYLGMAGDWDSGRLLLLAVILVAVAGALLVLLPRPVRLGVLSLWVLFHFGGIFTACVGSDPTQTQSPWLAGKASEYLYRDYLGFLYLTNAYHFYSPDPGPQDLIWFRIKYADGTVREVRMPERGQSPVPLHFTRHIALGNSIMMSQPYFVLGDDATNRIVQKRNAAIVAFGIPLHPGVLLAQQYREPTESTKLYLASYVRHIAYNYPHPDGKPEIAIESIRVYHVIHELMNPRELAEGYSPMSPLYYRPYYMGEYKPTGAYTEAGKRDPLLYWLLPIFKDPATGQMFDGLKRHTEGRIVDPNEKELD